MKQSYYFIFQGYNLLIVSEGQRVAPSSCAGLDDLLQQVQIIGELEGHECIAASVSSDVVAPEGMEFVHLRQLYQGLDEAQYWMAARARLLLEWNSTHQFCGRCGTGMVHDPGEMVKVCPACQLRRYPVLHPAIIVAVTKGDKILLARNHRYKVNFFSVLAGFVESGETLEETVKREVKEEVGIDVTNIRYVGSQSWPFPNSLMIGFSAEYVQGEFVLQEDEIAEAGWYSAEDLPPTPPPPSLAYTLIQAFINTQKRA